MPRPKRTREQKAIAKGKPYGIASERRQLNHRRTSSSIYENGKLSYEIKRQLQCGVPYYRFVGVKTDRHWSIADIPELWPEIEKLVKAKQELELAREAGTETKMKRGNVKHKRRVLEAIASWIDGQAMKPIRV